MEIFTKQVLRADFDISRSIGMVEASKVIVKKLAALTSKRKVDKWTEIPGFVFIRTLPVHKKHLNGGM